MSIIFATAVSVFIVLVITLIRVLHSKTIVINKLTLVPYWFAMVQIFLLLVYCSIILIIEPELYGEFMV